MAKALAREKREEIEKAKQAKAQMNPALLKETNEILGEINEAKQLTIKKMWGIGGRLVKIIENETKYGPNAYSLLMEATGYQRSYLQKAQALHRLFNDKQVEQILGMRMKHREDDGLSWMHVDKVLQINKTREALGLLKEACENDWTPVELQEAVDRFLGKKKSDRHAGGRPVKPPTTAEGRFSKFQKTTEIWLNQARSIYLDEKVGFVISVKEMPADRITPAFLEKIEEDEKLLIQLQQQADQLQKWIREAKQIAQKRAQEQAKTRAEAQTEHMNGSKKRGAQRPVGV
jgi:hypothetical protein